MKVFIITCIRDIDLFELQLKSIQKYLDIDELNVVVNENIHNFNSFKHFYGRNIFPFLKNNFTVNLIPKNSVLSGTRSDWVTQQILKLSCLDQSPYLVLDTKNIFIRHMSLNDFCNPARYHIDYLLNYKEFCNECIKLFPASYCRGAITPFIIDPRVCEKIFEKFQSYENFCTWFSKFNQPSEFILYDLAAQYFKIEEDLNTKIRCEEQVILIFDKSKSYKHVFKKVNNQNVKILSIHPRVFRDKSFQPYLKVLIEKYL